ncbi:FecR family protein [uncultured Mesonia sp.]|uniref:FecR family protein n=1 Tax=uncultured Mesonia sp. TaxID=399731 RepID=UPI00374F9F26
MKPEQFKKLIRNYLEGSCTDAQRRQVEAFLREQQNASIVIKQRPFANARIWMRIKKGLPQLKVRSNRVVIASAMVAILILIFMLPHFLIKTNTNQITEKGEKKVFILPDGSEIHLNSASQLSYTKDFKNKRRIQFNGQAFFSIAQDSLKPFTIETGEAQIRVLGTSFDVNTYHNERLVVEVTEGSVEVEKGGASIVLEAQDRLVWEQSTWRCERVVNTDENWRQHWLIIKNQKLSSAIKQIEIWYNTRIELGKNLDKDYRVSGKFKKAELEEVLASLSHIYNLNIKLIKPNHYVIEN